MGQVLTEEDNDWTVVMGNLKNPWKIWAQLMRILGREGADPRLSKMFFKEVVRAVSVFGSETWVLTHHMERALGSFQHRVRRRITRRQPRKRGEGGWYYPPLESAM